MPNAGVLIVVAFLSSVTVTACAQSSDPNLLNREGIESRQKELESQQQRHAKSMGAIRSQHQLLHDNRLEVSKQETDFLLQLIDRLERLEKRLDAIEEKMRLPGAPQN